MKSKVLVLLLVALVGCRPATPQVPPTATAPVEVGMPNPASVYCEEQGHTLEIRTADDGGQYGVCIFDDGSECEEWAFFHGECTPGAAVVGMPNPASVYCEEQGYTLEIRTSADGGEYGVCIFDDGSECEEWAFFRGECAPGDWAPLSDADCQALQAELTQLLGVNVTVARASFYDPFANERGLCCRNLAEGTGLDFESFWSVAEDIAVILAAAGWEQDPMYVADGPTGTGMGFRRGGDLCLLTVGWTPSDDANCPTDQPISACELEPEQQEYTITLDCARPTP